jgi:hypothetical protein
LTAAICQLVTKNRVLTFLQKKIKVFLKASLEELVLRIYTIYKDVDKTLLR